jgi:hypothetical protein
VEGTGDELGEELAAGEGGRLTAADMGEGARGAEQPLDRVVAEEGGEEAGNGRQLCDLAGDVRPTPCSRSPLDSAAGSEWARPTIISEKKMPIDSDVPELKNVPCIPDAIPR